MSSFIRRGLLLACLVGMFCCTGCRDEDKAPSTAPDMNTKSTGTPGS